MWRGDRELSPLLGGSSEVRARIKFRKNILFTVVVVAAVMAIKLTAWRVAAGDSDMDHIVALEQQFKTNVDHLNPIVNFDEADVAEAGKGVPAAPKTVASAPKPSAAPSPAAVTQTEESDDGIVTNVDHLNSVVDFQGVAGKESPIAPPGSAAAPASAAPVIAAPPAPAAPTVAPVAAAPAPASPPAPAAAAPAAPPAPAAPAAPPALAAPPAPAAPAAPASATSGEDGLRTNVDDLDVFSGIKDKVQSVRDGLDAKEREMATEKGVSGPTASGNGTTSTTSEEVKTNVDGVDGISAFLDKMKKVSDAIGKEKASGASSPAPSASAGNTTSSSNGTGTPTEVETHVDTLDPISQIYNKMKIISDHINRAQAAAANTTGVAVAEGSKDETNSDLLDPILNLRKRIDTIRELTPKSTEAAKVEDAPASVDGPTNVDEFDPVLTVADKISKVADLTPKEQVAEAPPMPVGKASGPTHLDEWDLVDKFEQVAKELHKLAKKEGGKVVPGPPPSINGDVNMDEWDVLKHVDELGEDLEKQEKKGEIKPGLADYFEGMFGGEGLGHWIDRIKPTGPYDVVKDGKNVASGSGSGKKNETLTLAKEEEYGREEAEDIKKLDDVDAGEWDFPAWSAPQWAWVMVSGPILSVGIALFVYQQTDNNPHAAMTSLIACAIVDISVFYNLSS